MRSERHVYSPAKKKRVKYQKNKKRGIFWQQQNQHLLGCPHVDFGTGAECGLCCPTAVRELGLFRLMGASPSSRLPRCILWSS